MMARRTWSGGRQAGLAGLLLAATLIAYLPAIRGGFIWDDDAHVTRPDLRSWAGLSRIWTEIGATQQYYPVLHSAFWLEHRLWGDAPLGYHLLNVLLHAAASLLFVKVLRRLEYRPEIAWLAGFLFALHPICVESVAWVSEQKNTLSTVFYLLAGLVYLRFHQRWTGRLDRIGGEGFRSLLALYLSASLLFILALLTKTVTATLPAALLLVLCLDHSGRAPDAPLRSKRKPFIRDLIPLLPWLLAGAAAGLFTAWIERSYIGAQGVHFQLSIGERLALAGRAVCFYLAKLAWPTRLEFIYPRWNLSPRIGQYGGLLAVAALLSASWAARRRCGGALAALLLFIGTLFPALGFVSVYPFLFSYVADHFAYLASLAVFAAAAAIIGRWTLAGGRRWPASILLAAFLGVLTFWQCRSYGNVRTLYEITLRQNPSAWLAHLNLAGLLLEDGEIGPAVAHYREAERLEPDYPSTHFDLAKVYQRMGDPARAAAEYAAALRLNPGDGEAADDLGIVLAEVGRLGEAEEVLKQAVRLRPKSARAQANLGSVLLQEGRPEDAVGRYRIAVALDPGLAEPHCNLGLALMKLGRMAEAKSQFEAALKIDPESAAARDNLDRLGKALEAGR